jgi:hypothetical protein
MDKKMTREEYLKLQEWLQIQNDKVFIVCIGANMAQNPGTRLLSDVDMDNFNPRTYRWRDYK